MRLAALWILAGLVNLAHADPEARRRLEELEREARDTGDHTKYAACGQGYLDLYTADPTQPRAEELLYNAGVCFTVGRRAGAAIQALELVRAKHGQGPLGARVLGRLALLYRDVADLPKAAALLEEYATRYPAEQDAYQAVSDAVHVHGALGNEVKQLALAERFVKTYGARRPREAADAMFAMTAVHERRGVGPAIQHLQRFLREWGGKAPLEQRAIALVKLGELQWRQACPVTPIDGLCVKAVPVKPDPAGPKAVKLRCEPITTPRLEPVARGAQPARTALATLEAALRLEPSIQDPTAKAYFARARLVRADHALEAYLAGVKFPTGLSFDPANQAVRDASLKRFEEFLSRSQQLGGQAQRAYDAILATRDPVMSIAAASRLGRLAETLADALAHAEIPKDVRGGQYATEKIQAFCDQMTAVSEPLYARAKEAYAVCAVKSAELGLAGAWPEACARGGGELVPHAFPLAVVPEPAIPPRPRHSKALATLLAEVGRLGAQPARAACTTLATKLEAAGKQDRDADAFFAAGLVHRRCGGLAEARAMYGKARDLDPKHAAALSSLGELSWIAGNRDAARAQWRDALALDGSLFAAHVDLAIVGLGELVDGRAADPRAMLAEVTRHAASAHVVEPDRALPHALLAIAQLVAPGGSRSLAEYHTAYAARLEPAHVLVRMLQAGLWLERGLAIGPLLDELAATTTTPRDDATTLALALHLVRVRRWDAARAELARVQAKSYERAVALGILARVAGKHADAEARYAEAIALAPARPEAHFDLGLLLKDHVAPGAADRKATLRRAAEAFRRAGTAEAKALAAECDRLAK